MLELFRDLGYPEIPPLPDGESRPRWSVMIPTYNCAALLRQTLESVLAQDPGPEVMQIEVIDDDREVLNMLGKWEIVTCVNLSQDWLIGGLKRAHGHDDFPFTGGAPFAERKAEPKPGGWPGRGIMATVLPASRGSGDAGRCGQAEF